MFFIIVKALAPIIVILLLGFWAGKRKLVDNSNVSILNIFLMDFALPCTLFLATIQTPFSGILKQLPLVVIVVLSMWIVYAIFFLVSLKIFKKSAQDAAVLTLTVALPNYAALGLPIVGGAIGESDLITLSVAIAIACGGVLMTPFCLMSLEAGKAKSQGKEVALIKILPKLMYTSFKKPIALGPTIGVVGSIILSLGDWSFPSLVVIALKPLAMATLGSALFLTGVILSARKLEFNTAAISGALTKNILQGFLAWGIFIVFGISAEVGHVGILLLALPAGFFGVVFGSRYGVQSPDAEATLLISTALFLVTAPLFIYLTAGLY